MPAITRLYIMPVPSGPRVDLPASGIIDAAALANGTIGVEVSGTCKSVDFTLRTPGGAIVMLTETTGTALPATITRKSLPFLITRTALRLPPTQFVLDVVAYEGDRSGATAKAHVNLSIADAAPVPPVEPAPDTTLPTDVNTTDWDAFAANPNGKLVGRRGVLYKATRGKVISGIFNGSMEAEGGSGPPPAIDASALSPGAALLVMTAAAQGFRIEGAPWRVYLGAIGGASLAFLRGRGHRLPFWAWGGSTVYESRDNNLTDCLIEGGGLLDKIGRYFWYGGGNFILRDIDARQQSVNEHIIRIYFGRDFLIQRVRAKLLPLAKGSAGLRVQDCRGGLVEDCEFEARFNKLTPLNQSSTDPYWVDNLTIRRTKFIGDVYVGYGTRGIVFDQTVHECGDYAPFTCQRGTPVAGKGPPTGKLIGVRISSKNGNGAIITGDTHALTADGDCRYTNPTRGWTDRAVTANLKVA